MFATMLFAIAIVALFQFAIYYWRAVLTGVAAQPISHQVLDAMQLTEPRLCGDDFERLASLHELTPELQTGDSGLGFIRAYYLAVRKAAELFGKASPALFNWSEHERELCARYAAVQIDRRLQANLAEAASVRSC
jgi:hypothetical protein